MPGVTISASYGAGGSVIAPAVAEQLNLPLLDRAISSLVAAQLHVSVQEAEGGEMRRSLVEKFLAVSAFSHCETAVTPSDTSMPNLEIGK